MDFSFSPDQEELRGYARRWLDGRAPETRHLIETVEGFDRGQWSEMAAMGWQAMAIPEQYGGAGFGMLELFVLLEEQGRTLLCAPFFSTAVLAATALVEGGTEELRREWLPAIATGEAIGTFADIGAVEATRSGERWVLSGSKRFVVDGHVADLVVVSADSGGETELFVVEAKSIVVSQVDSLDATRRLAEIRIDQVSVPETSRLTGGATTRGHVLAWAAVGLAAEQVGGAARCLEMAVGHAKDRRQFGRPIGSFQAIKHRCADMHIAIEAARAAAMYAAWAISERSEEMATAVPLAKAFCSEAFYRCAAENIQIHGGIGFTWEHDAHLYFKRAKSSEQLFGSPTAHRLALAEAIGIRP